MNYVEIYIEKDTEKLIYDNEHLDKWDSIVGALGLDKQAGLKEPSKSPISFMFMNKSLQNVCRELCPRTDRLQEYDRTPIPVEVLEIIKLAIDEQYFNNIEIWYDDKDPDPVAVGITGHWYEYQYGTDANKELAGKQYKTKQEVHDAGGKRAEFFSSKYYLIARWGDVKKSLEDLKQLAIDRYCRNKKAELEEKIIDAQHDLEKLNIEVVKMFG